MNKRIKIGIVDDHPWFRSTLAELLQKHRPDFEITVQATNGKELIDAIGHLPEDKIPDIVSIDVNMTVLDGFETAKFLRRHFPEIKIVALSLNNDESSIIRMIRLGVSGYLYKSIDGEELFAALHEVATVGYCSKGFITPALIQSIQSNPLREIWDGLGEKEKEFVCLCCTDLKYREIAAQMKVANSTLELMREKIFAKFGVKGRIGLVILAVKHNLIAEKSFY